MLKIITHYLLQLRDKSGFYVFISHIIHFLYFLVFAFFSPNLKKKVRENSLSFDALEMMCSFTSHFLVLYVECFFKNIWRANILLVGIEKKRVQKQAFEEIEKKILNSLKHFSTNRSIHFHFVSPYYSIL